MIQEVINKAVRRAREIASAPRPGSFYGMFFDEKGEEFSGSDVQSARYFIVTEPFRGAGYRVLELVPSGYQELTTIYV